MKFNFPIDRLTNKSKYLILLMLMCNVIQEVPSSIPGYTRIFSGSIQSGTGSIQPREDKWVAALYEKYRNPVKKTEIRVEGIALR